jgi:U3 small nucleolar RNA-associated protein 6
MAIAKKRSDFEHKLNARGSRPIDYTRYLEYEQALDGLKTKRTKRMGSKGAGPHTSARRMMFIMERATRKFHGDLSLWTQYFQVARRQKAYKKATQILTSMVRLHPTKPEVWTYAAKYTAEEQGDMPNARSYMIRGLRFCKYSRQIYLDYTKLELIYIAKIAARRQILGLDQAREQTTEDPEAEDPDADMVALPKLTAEDIDPSLRTDDKADEEALNALNRTPALTGAIPLTIFDAAMALFNDAELGGQFFDMIASTSQIPCSSNVAKHIQEKLSAMAPNSPATLDATIRLPLVGVEPTSADFPRVLGLVLPQLKSSFHKHPSQELAIRTICWITSYLSLELDQGIRTVLSSVLSRTVAQYEELAGQAGRISENDTKRILEEVKKAQLPALEACFATWAREMSSHANGDIKAATDRPTAAIAAS